jgi:hypothetical protein
MEVQEEIITNYKSLIDLRKSTPKETTVELKQEKYETDSEFSERVKIASARKKIKRFYVEYESVFWVPDNNSIVTFAYPSPFGGIGRKRIRELRIK